MKSSKINVISQQKVQNGVKSVNNVGIVNTYPVNVVIIHVNIFSVI